MSESTDAWYKRTMPRLVVHEPGGVATSVQVENEVQIGRDAGMQVVLGDGKVSRHHATISREGEGWVVVDAESRHGTYVNGERVSRHALTDGDQLQIGSTVLRFEQFDLDEAEARLTRAGRPVPLAPKPFAVLCALARTPSMLVTKNALLDAVWGHRFVTESVLKSAISEVRAALGDDPKAPRYLQTVRGVGYRLAPD